VHIFCCYSNVVFRDANNNYAAAAANDEEDEYILHWVW